MRTHDILLLSLGDSFPFEVVEVLAVQIEDNFRRVVEEDTRGTVREQVAETVLGRVVDPFLYPDRRASYFSCTFLGDLRNSLILGTHGNLVLVCRFPVHEPISICEEHIRRLGAR